MGSIELLSDRSPRKRGSDYATLQQAHDIALGLTNGAAAFIVDGLKQQLATVVNAHNALLLRVVALEALHGIAPPPDSVPDDPPDIPASDVSVSVL